MEGFAGFYVALTAAVYVFLKYAKLWELESRRNVAASGGVDAGKLLKDFARRSGRNWGGGEARIFGLLSFLVSKGHSNDILTHPAGQLYDEVAKLKVGRFPLSARNDLDLRAVCSIRRRIKKGNYDIVHLHTKRAHALSLWLNRGKKLPKYVVTRRMDYVEKNNCVYPLPL